MYVTINAMSIGEAAFMFDFWTEYEGFCFVGK